MALKACAQKKEAELSLQWCPLGTIITLSNQLNESKAMASQTTTWMERFQSALAVMCGALPPLDMCQEWVDHIEVNGEYRLQNWIFSKGNKTPQWAQAIVTIDAAQLWADGPEEGAGHAPKPVTCKAA